MSNEKDTTKADNILAAPKVEATALRSHSIDEHAQDVAGYDHDLMSARTLLSYEEERKLLRRVDWHLMPLCALIFMVKNIDANNAANARIMNRGTSRNILTELGMTGDEYNFVSTVYFIPFIVFEIPSNLVMKKMLPSRFQSDLGHCPSISCCCIVEEWLVCARFFLGLCEAGMFPGIILQLTYWYRADEMTMRLLIYCSLEFFANVVSAVLAFGFDHISGRGGLSGWQWFFLVEGVITIAFGALLWFVFPDFPEQAKWLSDKEKAFLQARLPANAPRSSEMNFNWREVIETLKDQRLWLFTLVFIAKTVGASDLTFYLPTIVADLGLTSIAESQLLTIPASVLPIILIAIASLLTTRFNIPLPLIPLTYMTITLAMYAILHTYPNNGGVYAATIIAGGLGNAWYPSMWPWRLQTTSKATGNAFAIAFTNSLGGIGSLIGPQIFRMKYAPKYGVSFAVAMAFTGFCVVMTGWTWWVTRLTERRTREIRRERMKAGLKGEVVLGDVDIGADLERKRRRGDA
ncbi:MFS transporter prlL [Fulvia fulva]|nr:MFS transporter prlL [Fulvia fulva]KAK4611141.1 MFS transporter prlL [Fulvia fulva]WPV21760.1 MFS transporter prlL [Fulvia fulva]WPV37071.1 MFS transporter prlL [Fulvia fulva]